MMNILSVTFCFLIFIASSVCRHYLIKVDTNYRNIEVGGPPEESSGNDYFLDDFTAKVQGIPIHGILV